MESAGILAGPIVRRVDTDSVAVWVATDRPVKADAAIYHLDTNFRFVTTTNTTTVQAGHHLFIHLLQVIGRFPMDTLLGYVLLFHDGKNIFNLVDSIVYDGLHYPLFFFPAYAAPTFLYASCRKFHGKGDDALIAGDALNQIAARDQETRPSAIISYRRLDLRG
ncbi:hypothetical protein SLU01_24500 [Sporosarcina luteola]|uniref:Uncharacterized protein n=1 Tax=Sporosarcina luteola TaxID=582850 RepID=A0A511Z9N2_9BACL|nr:hypothetical protein [Sporosarcina luteola]GEN84138.1 hypothetical protein SLU01_24500 [Sporosarcina luteola]